MEHVLRHSIRYLSGHEDANGSPKSPTLAAQKPTSRVAETLKALQASKDWKLNTITSGDNGAVVELLDLSTLPPKISQPLFCISTITSLEHAISLVDESLEAPHRLLAAYHFGTSATGKYLSQFINADVSFINHIPSTLLLGPSAPSYHSIDVAKRYNTSHFSHSLPAYITPPFHQFTVTAASVLTRVSTQELLAKASSEIKEKKRAEWIAIGYFEQGIFVGLGVYGIPLLTCLGASLWFGVRAGLRRWALI